MKLQNLAKQGPIKFVADERLAYIFLFFALILFALPLILRGGIFVGQESFINHRYAEMMLNRYFYDSLSFGGRELFQFNMWAMLIGLISSVTQLSINFIAIVFTYFIAIFSFILIFMILKRLKFEKMQINITLFILLISPLMLFMVSRFSELIISFLLMLLAILLFLEYKYKWSLLTTVAIALFNIHISALFLIITFVYFYYYNRRFIGEWFIAFFGSIAVFLILNFNAIKIFGLVETIKIFAMQNTYFVRLISDFGGRLGAPIFVLIIVLVSFRFYYKRFFQSLDLLMITVFLFIAALIFVESLIFLNLAFAIFAALGISNLIKTEWKSKTLLSLTLILIICGIIFSSLTYINEIQNKEPSKEIVDAMYHLKLNSTSGDVVFSSQDNGIWISALAVRKNVMDNNFRFAPNLGERIDDSVKLFMSRDLNETEKLLNKYHVGYVLIDEKMKREIWQGDVDGMRFVVEHSSKFQKVYANKDIEVWKFE